MTCKIFIFSVDPADAMKKIYSILKFNRWSYCLKLIVNDIMLGKYMDYKGTLLNFIRFNCLEMIMFSSTRHNDILHTSES